MKTASFFLMLVAGMLVHTRLQPEIAGRRAGDWFGEDRIMSIDPQTQIVNVRLHGRAVEHRGYISTAMSYAEFERYMELRRWRPASANHQIE